MEKITEHEAFADELSAILKDAPYSTKGQVAALRAKYTHAFNSGYEQEKLHQACASVEAVLTARGSSDDRKQSIAREDISKVRKLKNFRA
jgi:ElaB/YqjD/DUF883 family membrane-anchored ribosome-binding protein